MKRPKSKSTMARRRGGDGMLPEYDFSRARRNKYASCYAKGALVVTGGCHEETSRAPAVAANRASREVSRDCVGPRKDRGSCPARRPRAPVPRRVEEEGSMRIVALSMTADECDSAPFANVEYYFKLRQIVTWEEKGFVSNLF